MSDTKVAVTEPEATEVRTHVNAVIPPGFKPLVEVAIFADLTAIGTHAQINDALLKPASQRCPHVGGPVMKKLGGTYDRSSSH